MIELDPGRRGALSGLVIADFSRVLAGPYMTMLLGDLGATVIKVESPDGDGTRTWGPPWYEGESTYFHAVNRNKRSIVLDLKDDADQELARRLVARADVLVQNLLPGRMAAYGLDYESARKINQRLVYCSISGFGSQPGGASLPGYDMLAQAASGLMSITGAEGGPALKSGVALVDILTGLHGAVGVLAALSSRARDGRGQHVEVDLMSTALSALTNQASGYLLAGAKPQRLGNAHPSVAPYDTFPASDGDVVIAVGTDRQFQQLCQGLDVGHLAHDGRFRTNGARAVNRAELTRLLSEALAGFTREEVVARLRPLGVPCGALNDLPEAFAFAESIGLAPTWSHAGARYVRNPITLSDTPPEITLTPPVLDSSGEEIRRWLSA